uniref:Uncharacterized protein n=1 Tax=Arion vulgaris TaxID=1028688 RepID=A0A0B7AH50_9EUPU
MDWMPSQDKNSRMVKICSGYLRDSGRKGDLVTHELLKAELEDMHRTRFELERKAQD